MKPQPRKPEVTRKNLIEADTTSQPAPSGFNLIADLIGTIDGGPTDISRRKKHYLKAKHYGTTRPL
jgi:hypothetical protein